jgi:PAS domain S-box-containing protein
MKERDVAPRLSPEKKAESSGSSAQTKLMPLRYKQAYTEERIRSGVRQIRLTFAVFISLYGLFAVLDHLLVGEHLQTFLFIRFGIVIPLMIVFIASTFHPSFHKFAQPFMVLCFVTGGTGIAYMLILYPENFSYYGGMYMVILAGYFLIKLDTPHSLLGGLVTLFLYVAGYAWHHGTLNIEVWMVVIFFLGANIIGALGNYQMEKAGQANFLHKREIHLQNELLQERVREQKAELLQIEKAIDSTSDAVAIFNPQGLATYRNTAYKLLMRSFSFPDMRVPRLFEDVLPNLLAGESWKGERTVSDHTGMDKVLLIQADAVHEESGNIAGIVTTCRDITERKQSEQMLRESEEHLRSIFRSAPIGIGSVVNRELKRVNSRLCEMTGYDEGELVGRSSRLLYPTSEDFEFVGREKYAQIRDHGTGTVETCWQRKDGTIIDVLLSSTPVDLRDHSKGVTFTALDITERKLAEKERERLQMQLTQAQKMEAVGQLAGGVAHDFNNMLGVILGYSELILEHVDSSHQFHGELEEIQKAAGRSADLTRQLLTFARKQTVAPRVLDLNQTIEGMLNMLRRLIGENIDLIWMPGSGLWPISMDPSQIDQILANLCVNARDAIGGVGKLTVETRNATLDRDYCANHDGTLPGEYVRITVSDTGKGMDKETLAHIFEPFFTTKDVGEGTGLGLATVYGAVKQNNGFINAYSEPGQGTTLVIHIPRHAETITEKRIIVSPEPVVHGDEIVLLVEDEPILLQMSKTMLERLGYSVLAAGTPNEAIRIAEEYSGRIHLLATDVIMPEMNGRELSARLLKSRPGMKCLFMSGYTANIIAGQGVLKAGESFIQKPFSKNELARKVREAIKS